MTAHVLIRELSNTDHVPQQARIKQLSRHESCVPMAIIKQLSRHESCGLAGDYQADEQP